MPLAVFERQLSIAVSPLLEQGKRAKLIARYAERVRDETLAEQRGRGGMEPSVEQTVDGRKGAPLESIRAGGVIRFDFLYMREIAEYALTWLRDNTPLGRGPKRSSNRHYRDAHFVMAGGSEVGPAAIAGPAREIIVTNDQPYARKLQTRGGRLIGLAPGLYDRARKAMQSRYGRVVEVQLRFIRLDGAYQLKGGGKSRRRDRQAGRELSYPALIITAR